MPQEGRGGVQVAELLLHIVVDRAALVEVPTCRSKACEVNPRMNAKVAKKLADGEYLDNPSAFVHTFATKARYKVSSTNRR